ncbi:hypothetical protein ABEF92_002206 [Exophiala dermatitidis]|uniref:Uncharacterized protein n=2 Tax=Exophiala dermatitidis TaxID=5970 RepID=H6BUY5_EXODN|nr:uncharacterized protein HMPREF1120_03114 [Exophiala dermatitidis NIH/UT8656]EHY54955.1 hypothetical protein HMPREF1120_03114 [Exophiala dermatitidis NIH/UT8656]
MWSLAPIIGVAVAGAVVLLITGVLLAVSIERRRHRYLMQTHGLSRGLSTYHRAKLSANENNYSHITAPTTYLRRSVQLPYGVISVGRVHPDAIFEEEEAGDHTAQLLRYDHGSLQPKGRRSIRRSFTGQPLNIPKTRRQNKLRKAMPLNQMQHSPLSAITEFTDSPPCSSPAATESLPEGAARIVTSVAPGSKGERQISLQWPLVISKTRGSSDVTPTEVMSMAARASMLMRMGGGITHTSNSSRPTPVNTTVPRSVSMSSTTSSAPDDPLPPLPTIDVYKHPRTQELRARASNASLDTVGSSVLGSAVGSPSSNVRENNVSNQGISTRLRGLDSRQGQKTSGPRLQVPPVKQTIHGLCVSKPSFHSLHPSFDVNEASPEPRGDDSRQGRPAARMTREDSFKTIDASQWENPLPLRIKKIRSAGSNPARHSMYESSKVQQWRAVSDPMATDLCHSPASLAGNAIKRPASVATGNPLQWDRQGDFATNRHSLSSLDGPRRGHRRQNCVRITNLPAIEPRQKILGQMPELREELQNVDAPDTDADDADNFQPPQSSVPVPRTQTTVMAPASTVDSISPFRNRPVLTPSSRPLPRQHNEPRSSASLGIPRADSDIFNPSHVGAAPSSNYNTSPRQWMFSPDSKVNTGVHSSPLSGRPSAIHPFDSPTLPSPTLNSSSLYPRKSLVKGPRNPRGSGSSPSPLQNKQGPNFRVSKERESSTTRERDRDRDRDREIDLRKSVMMLRSMNSEGGLLDQSHGNGSSNTSLRFYRNIGGESNSSTPDPYRTVVASANATPPLNKRISGLRNSAYGASSTMTISPVLDKDRSTSTATSRGCSPLVHSTSINMANSANSLTMNRSKAGVAGAASHVALFPPSQAFPFGSTTPIAASPSGISIWEDASVHTESPEPEGVRTPPTLGTGVGFDSSSLHVTPLALRPKRDADVPAGRSGCGYQMHPESQFLPVGKQQQEQRQHQHQQQTRQLSSPPRNYNGLSICRPQTPNKAYPYPSPRSATATTSSPRQRSGPSSAGMYMLLQPLADNGNSKHNLCRHERDGTSDNNNTETDTDAENPSSHLYSQSYSTASPNLNPKSSLVQRLEQAVTGTHWSTSTATRNSPARSNDVDQPPFYSKVVLDHSKRPDRDRASGPIPSALLRARSASNNLNTHNIQHSTTDSGWVAVNGPLNPLTQFQKGHGQHHQAAPSSSFTDTHRHDRRRLSHRSVPSRAKGDSDSVDENDDDNDGDNLSGGNDRMNPGYNNGGIGIGVGIGLGLQLPDGILGHAN